MKKSLFLLILGITLFSSHFVFSQWSHHSITHNDLERDYWMYVPSSYDENIPAKIVVTLHGMGDNDTNFRNIGFNLVADTANIIVIVPNALPFHSDNPIIEGVIGGSRTWNSGAGVSIPFIGDVFPNSHIDDVSFINWLVDDTKANYSIDASRIYICGFSKGGFMTQRMAIESNGRYAAFGTVAGTYGTGLENPNPGRAIPLIHINGTADDRVNWEENNPTLPFEHFVGDMIDFWVTNNNCDETPIVTEIPDIANDGFTVEHYLYDNGDDGTVFELFKVNGAEHVWLGNGFDINYTHELWKFFNRYSYATAGLNTVENVQFKVYPNPTDDKLFIQLQSEENKQMNIVDLNGKIIYSTSIQGSKIIDLSGFESGVYFVKIGSVSQKIIRR